MQSMPADFSRRNTSSTGIRNSFEKKSISTDVKAFTVAAGAALFSARNISS